MDAFPSFDPNKTSDDWKLISCGSSATPVTSEPLTLNDEEVLPADEPQPKTIKGLVNKISEQQKEIMRLTKLVEDMKLKEEEAKLKNEAAKEQQHRLQRIAEIVKENLKCPLCQTLSILPLVLGTCGHHMCERCLMAYDTMSQRRVCPTCRQDIVGLGFPMISLNSIVAALIEGDFISDASDSLLNNGFRKGAPMGYPKPTAPHMHAEALRIASWAQTRLGTFGAVHAVATAKQLSPNVDPFHSGVLFYFEPSTSLQFVDVVARLCINRYGMVVGRVKNQPTFTVQYREAGDKQIPFKPLLCIQVRADGHVLPLSPESALAQTQFEAAKGMASAHIFSTHIVSTVPTETKTRPEMDMKEEKRRGDMRSTEKQRKFAILFTSHKRGILQYSITKNKRLIPKLFISLTIAPPPNSFVSTFSLAICPLSSSKKTRCEEEVLILNQSCFLEVRSNRVPLLYYVQHSEWGERK